MKFSGQLLQPVQGYWFLQGTGENCYVLESGAWNEDLSLFPEFGFPTVGLASVNMHLKTVTKLCAWKLAGSTSTINFSLADLTISGQYSKVSSDMVLWMQKKWRADVLGIWNILPQLVWLRGELKDLLEKNLQTQPIKEMQSWSSASVSGSCNTSCRNSRNTLHQVMWSPVPSNTGFDSLDFPLHTLSNLSGLQVIWNAC